MLFPPACRYDVLALLGDRRPMQTFVRHLRRAGCGVDVATDTTSARAAFLDSGGHQCLVIGPDVTPALALQVLASLRAVDPGLCAASFGPGIPRNEVPTRNAVLSGLAPGSRAGLGAFVRFLRALPETGPLTS